MAKLSQQLAMRDQRDVRLPRSERVREKQAQKRFLLEQTREKAKFEELKIQAEKIQEEKFKDKVITETFYKERPKSFSVNHWGRLDSGLKSRYLERAKKRGEEIIRTKSTRQKTIPFKIKNGEHTYQKIYQNLSPDLKQFFDSPDIVLEKKADRILETIKTTQEKLSYADQRIAKAKIDYNKDIQRNEEWYNRKGRYRDQYRERFKKNKNETEDDYEEELAKWRGYKEGLNKGIKELQANKDLKFSDIESYALNLGDYEERRKEAKNEKREFDRKQKDKIKKLEEKGYVPYIIEKSFKGKAKETYFEFYKKETGDWQRVATFKPPKEISTARLKKSKLGRVQLERSLFIGGKEFKFKSNLQLFVDPSGKLSTRFGYIGKNEKQIMKQAQDQAFQDFQKTQIDVVPIKELQLKTTIVDRAFGKIKGFLSSYKLGFTKTSIPKLTIQRKQDDDAGQKLASELLKQGIGKVRAGYKAIPSPDVYIKPLSLKNLLSGKVGGLTFIGKTSKGDIKLADIKEMGLKSLTKKEKIATEKQLERIGIKDIQKEFGEKRQKRFETKYMKGLIYGEKTFEEATKEFETSKEAKILQRNYEIMVENELRKAGITKQGFQLVGLGLTKSALSLVPTTTKGVILTGALVYGGIKAYKLIPTKVLYGTSVGFAAYGSYKVLSPTSTPSERAAGIVTAGVSAGFLGFGAYRYFKSPVIKTIKIKPKLSAKIQKIVAFETRPIVKTDVFGKITKIERTIVPKTLSRQIIEGRKTIITTKGREFLAKYTKIKLDPIYKGIPSQQLGKIVTIESLRGFYTYRTPSGYKKAFDKLTKFGYTKSQARSTLRYIAPKVIDTELKSINVLYSGSAIKIPFAKAKTEVITKQPKIEFGVAGLKTRGAKTIKDIYRSDKAIVGTFKDKVIIKEASIRTRVFLTDQGAMFNKIRQIGRTTVQFERTILAKAGFVKKGQVIIGGSRDLKLIISKEYRYQNLKEVFRQRQIVPKQLRELYGGQKVKLIKTKLDPLFIDERKLTGIRVREIFTPTKLAKVKTIEQMSNKKLKEMIRDLQKIYGTGKILPKLKLPKRIGKPSVILDQVDDATIKSARNQVSKYYGTGQYERTAGGISPQELKGLDFPQIKIPDIRLRTQIKEISKIDNLMRVNIASLVSIKSLTDLKTDFKLKINLKNILRTDLVLKTKQSAALKQVPSLKTLLKTQLNIQKISLSLLSPSIIIPKIPVITTPPFRPKPFFIPILMSKIKKRLSTKKKKLIQEFAFLPDFTAKALGLKPEIITGKQAQAKVRKILTGLEIRRPVKIK